MANIYLSITELCSQLQIARSTLDRWRALGVGVHLVLSSSNRWFTSAFTFTEKLIFLLSCQVRLVPQLRAVMVT